MKIQGQRVPCGAGGRDARPQDAGWAQPGNDLSEQRLSPAALSLVRILRGFAAPRGSPPRTETKTEADTMQCPKCAHENPAQASTCVRCGIVFEKYYKYHPRPGDVPAPALPVPRPRHSSPPREGLWGLILPSDPKGDWVTLGARALVLLGLDPLGLQPHGRVRGLGRRRDSPSCTTPTSPFTRPGTSCSAPSGHTWHPWAGPWGNS